MNERAIAYRAMNDIPAEWGTAVNVVPLVGHGTVRGAVLGYGDVGFNGSEVIKTPHLDAMAKRGARFERFYAGAPQGTVRPQFP